MDGAGRDYYVYSGQSITFTYRAKADQGLADGTVLTNIAVLTSAPSDDAAKDLDSSEASVAVINPVKDSPSDFGDASKDKSTLDSSPKCGDNFLLGWIFELMGIFAK